MNLHISDHQVNFYVDNFFNLLDELSKSKDITISKSSQLVIRSINDREVQNEKDISQIRSAFISIFKTDEFIDFYKDYAKFISNAAGIDNNFLLQCQPTPRIVPPKSLATSFHCDKWYGHGDNTNTVWTPLHNILPGSGVCFIEDKEQNKALHSAFNNNDNFDEALKLFNDDAIKLSNEFCPTEPKCRIFGSSVIHGSPLNSSDFYRFSFDFRISDNLKNIGSKNFSDFYLYDHKSGSLKDIVIWPEGKNFLKYINGENNISTKTQHMILESFASDLDINIVGQEAEIENGHYPVLSYYLDEENLISHNFDGVLIASETVIGQNVLKKIISSKVKVIFALERLIT